MSPAKGFSLVEVLIVLMIMSILASSISYLVVGRQETLKNVVEDVTRNLRLIRQQAIRDDRSYQVQIDLGNNSLRFIDEVVDLAGDIAVTVRTARNQLINSDVAGMTFYPDASSSGGIITIENDQEIFEISVVWISGKIQTRHQLKSS